MAAAFLVAFGAGPRRAGADTSCQGFGSATPGGPAASVYHVTTTADQGPGSLRDAVSIGNRTVVFDTGGWFALASDIVVGGPFVTIDGTTAPVPVRLVHGGLVVSGAAGAHDVVIKHVRVGNAEGPAAISIVDGAYNVVVQQVALHDAAGASVDISGSHDVSVCWSLLANPISHNMSISGSARVSLHNNVLVGATAGNPTATIDGVGTPAPDTTLDMFNNVVWGWGAGWGTVISHGAAANVVANLYGSPGSPPDAQANALIVCDGDCTGGTAANARAYVARNVSDSGVDLDSQSTESLPFGAPAASVGDACLAAHATVAGVGVHPLDLIDQGALDAVDLPVDCAPDLIPESVSASASAAPGSSITLTDTVKNQGAGPAGPSTTRFYFSARNYLDETAVSLGTRSVPSLAAGVTDTGTTSVTIPATAGSACSYYILAKVDSEDVTPDSDPDNNVKAQAILVCPDLLVDAVGAPESATPGTTIEITDTVRNRGQSKAPATTVKLYFSAQSTYDASAVLIGSHSVPALDPDASHSGSTSVTVPASAGAAGLYYVIAVVDPDNVVSEYDEGNNSERWVKVAVGPDLHISGAVGAPASIVPGTVIQVTETTRNRGVSGAGPSVTKFYLGTTPTFNPAAPLIGSRPVPALAALAVSTATTSVTIPASTTAAGTYYLFAIADADNQILEPDETNNTTAYAEVRIGPDLHISGAVSAPASALAGATIQVTETTRNRGVSGAAASVTKFYLGTSITFDPAAPVIGSRPVPALAALAVSTATTSVTIPASAGAAGTYYLFAVTDANNQITESDETNNASYAVVRIGPDLHISGAVSAPASAVPGTAIQVTETTRNRGVSDAAASVTKFYLGTTATFNPAAPVIGSRPVPALAALAVSTATTSVAIPASAGAAGTYYLFAVADGDNQMTEPDETNNASYAVVKIGPDLHISGAVSAPASVLAGAAIQVTETTRNRGVSDAAASVTKFYLGTTPTFDPAAPLIGSRPVPALAALAVSTATTSVTIPASAGAAGTYYLFAVADGDNQMTEPDETNNASYAVVRIGPDLHISGAVSAPASALAGAVIQVTETTRNRGVSSAAASVTKFYLGTTPTFDPAAPLIGSRPVPALAALAVSTATTSVTIPASAGAAGTYYLFAVADGDNQMTEPDEANNAASAVVKIGPDLHISGGVGAPDTTTAGATIQVTETTRNRGVSGSPASVTKFYLSTSTTVDAAAILIGSRPVPALNALAISTATTPVTIPSSVGGTLNLIAAVDGENQVVEPDETNNTAWTTIRIGSDLVITGVNGPTTAAAGGAIVVSDSTKNKGAVPSPASTTRYYVSTSSTFGPGATLIGSRPVPALDAGVTNTGSITATLPMGIGGPYYLLAVANGDGQLPELDTTNNAGFTPISIGPDLIVTSVAAPTYFAPGMTITVSDNTKNTGAGTAAPSVTKYFLSASGAIDGASVLLGSHAVPGLDPGVLHTGSASVTIPTSATGGVYYVIALADGNSQVPEQNEANNTASTIVRMGADMVIDSVAVPATALAGGTIVVTDTTRNRGFSPAEASITRFYLSGQTALDGSAIPLGNRAVPVLAAGGTSTVSTTLAIPASVGQLGQYYILVVANGDGSLADLDQTNNLRYADIKIGPDLHISGGVLGVPAGGVAGTSIALTDTTRNRGVSGAGASVTRFYIGTTATFGASAIQIGSRAVPALEAGAIHTATTSVTIPASVGAATNYYIFAVADGDNQIIEPDEANNPSSGVLVKIGPDLHISGAISAPATAVAGGTISVTETTRNRGVSGAAASFTRFYLGTTPTLNAAAVEIGSRAVPALNAAATSTATTSVTIPTTAGAAGTYYLFAVSDATNQIAEPDETNNAAYAIVNIGPDLQISAISAPAVATADTTVQVTETTRNRGVSGAGASVTKFYLGTTPTFAASALYLGSRDVPALAAGAVSTATTSVTIPASTGAAGTYYLLAVADANAQIVETLETNNVGADALAIGPDLHISAISAPAVATAGTIIKVTETTRNRGIGPAAASVTKFYLGTTPTFAASALYLGSRDVPALAAGAVSTATTSVTIPASTGAAGTYYLFAVADANAEIVETLETNNATADSLKIGPDLHISAISAPAVATAGTIIKVTETTRNRGVGPAATSVTKFYLGTTPTFDASALYLGSRDVPALAALATHTATTSVAIPASAGAAGTYYLFAVADGDAQIVETLETNNATADSLKIGPDLVVDAISGPGTGHPGDDVILAATVRNRGAAPAAPTSLVFYLATQKTYDPLDAVFLGARSVPSLAAGALSGGSTTVALPTVPGNRTYYILAIADGLGASVETVEGNNLTYWSIWIP